MLKGPSPLWEVPFPGWVVRDSIRKLAKHEPSQAMCCTSLVVSFLGIGDAERNNSPALMDCDLEL